MSLTTCFAILFKEEKKKKKKIEEKNQKSIFFIQPNWLYYYLFFTQSLSIHMTQYVFVGEACDELPEFFSEIHSHSTISCRKSLVSRRSNGQSLNYCREDEWVLRLFDGRWANSEFLHSHMGIYSTNFFLSISITWDTNEAATTTKRYIGSCMLLAQDVAFHGVCFSPTRLRADK